MRALSFALTLLLCAPLAVSAAGAQTRGADDGLRALGEANRAARQSAGADTFERARQIHAYAAGAIYEIYANPAFVSAILLEPGERLSQAAAGDTGRWMVSEAISQTDGEARTIVLLRPNAAGLRTNLVIITDRRVYLIEAVSQAGRPYSAELAWTYPQNERAHHAPAAALNFAYRVRTIRGRRPVWTPTRVYDDGRKTWIEFADGARSGELPPVFAAGSEGPELINFRMSEEGGVLRYAIDGIYEALELRLGARAPIVVRIDRPSSSRRAHFRRRRP